jgi:hypothetical protein
MLEGGLIRGCANIASSRQAKKGSLPLRLSTYYLIIFQCLQCACQHDRNYSSSTHSVPRACYQPDWARAVYIRWRLSIACVADFSSYSADGAGHTSPGTATGCSVFAWTSSDAIDAVLSDTSAMMRWIFVVSSMLLQRSHHRCNGSEV